MVKNTQKRVAQTKQKTPTIHISKRDYTKVVRAKLTKNEEKSKVKPVLYDRIKQLLH